MERCALAKRRLVLLDERDTTGVRMALNLGHTLSHALEAATGYRLRHGEAVAYGLRAALGIGTSMGVTPARDWRPGPSGCSTAWASGPSRWTCRSTTVLAYIETDKKRRDGRLQWVLVTADGVTIRDDVPAAVAGAAVAASLRGSR